MQVTVKFIQIVLLLSFLFFFINLILQGVKAQLLHLSKLYAYSLLVLCVGVCVNTFLA